MCLFENKRIVVLAPHVDDAEYGCGGTIHKIYKNSELFYIIFSFAEKSLSNGFTRKMLEAEMLEASKVLGVQSENIISKNYEVREFPRDRQKILEDLIKIKKDLNPDIVFMPSSFDTHQDHKVIHEEGFRAFKDTTIFGYESILNNRAFTPHFYSILNKRNVDKKISAIKCFKSQIVKRENSIDFINSLSKVRGAQVRAAYAEAFEVIRLIL